MRDKSTGSRMRVSTDGRGGPYIVVPYLQLDEVKHVLERAGVHYWAEMNAVSVSGMAAMSVINLGKGCDVAKVQQHLDNVA